MNRRVHIGASLLLILAAAWFMAGCGKKASGQVEQIQASGIMRVAIVDTDSRYTDTEGEELVGIEPELARYIASALGVETRYQVCSKKEALEAVASGEADIAMGCINNSGSLSEEYLTSTSYGKGYFYAVTRTGDYALTAGAFEHSSLGVARELDEATRTMLYQAEGIRITDYDSAQTAGEDIKQGVIRAYICYEDQARKLLEDQELQVQNVFNLEPEEFVVVTAKSGAALTGGINTLIQQFLEKE